MCVIFGDPVIRFVDDLKELDNCIGYIYKNNISEIGIDLESNSLYRYYHDVCLIQIAAGDKIWLIDSLKLKCPPILKNLLEDDNITKIFQDMQYDLALLTFNYNCNVNNVFDISIADRLVRQSNNNRKLSYIVEDFLGFTSKIPNKSQKSNWGKRPLTDKQIQYAAYDVMYLTDIYLSIIDIFKNDFRFECLLTFVEKYRPKDYRRKYNVNSMWKIKNIENLSQVQLFRLKNLLLARDIIGQELNKPLYWISNENILRDLAESDLSVKSDIMRFLEERNAYNRYIQRGIKHLVDACSNSKSTSEKLEPPEYGVSLKTWIPLDDPVYLDYYPDPER
ncbi:MAG: hypothetical protein ACXAC2_13100, partial [Candidatus Kariarchaeaceae archaeon]